MITIITGTPGAGKTLYTIEKLLQPLIGTQVPVVGDDGVTTIHPRTIYSNINGLLLDHELIDGGDSKGLRDWHTWAKPGSVIVFDEVQRFWKPRPNGSAVPPDIEALETHRHMGVDFIIITQNVLLVDRNIHALAGRHLHVRRLANTHMAIVYEWDHVSRGLLYAKSLNKSPWRYSRKVFELYKSAEAHTKQPRKIPGLVWFIAAAIVGLSTLGPVTYARLTERINGGKTSTLADAPKTPASGIGARPAAPQVASLPASPAASAPASDPAPVEALPVFAGCIQSKTRCECYDTAGALAQRFDGVCQDYTTPKPNLLAGGTFADPPAPRLAEPPQLYLVPQESGHGLEDLKAAIRGVYSRPRL